MNSITKGRTSKVPFILSALILFILIHDYVPIVGFKTPSIVFAIIVTMAYFIAIIVMGAHHFSKLLLTILPLFLLNILRLLHHVITGQSGVFTEFYGMAQLLILPIFALFIIEKNDLKLARWTMAIIILCCVVTSITTYYGCLAFPNASRDLATTIRSEDLVLYSTYKLLNIGGFSFIYTLTLFIPIIIYLTKSRRINVFLAILIIVTFFLAIRQSEYTMALLLSVLGLLTLLLPVNLEKRKMRLFLVLAVFGVLLVYAFVPSVLRHYASTSQSEAVTERLNDLADVLSGGDQSISSDSDLRQRQDRFQASWDSFVDSNLLGGWSHAQVGGHSYFLDTLGSYGLLGMILLIIMYRSFYKLFIKPYKNIPWYGFIVFVFFLAVFQAAINTSNSFPFMSLVFPLLYLVDGNAK